MSVAALGQLLDVLGPASLHLITAPRGIDAPVSGTLVYEPRGALPPVGHALLLAVGVGPASPEAEELAREAAGLGFAGLVVKQYGDPALQLAAVAEEAGIALLSVEDPVPWHHLDALVSSALSAVAHTDRGGMAPAMGDLFGLANAIAAMVGGATTIEDPDRQILAYSVLPDQPVDEDRRQGILDLKVPYSPVNDPLYSELARSRGVCRFPSPPPGLPRLAVAVRAGQELLGSLWVVDARGDLGPEAEQALAEAADITALHLVRARSAEDLARRERGDLLRRLLADPASSRLLAPQLGLDAEAPVAVAAFVVASNGPDEALAARSSSRLADLVELHCAAHFGWNGCVLIDGTVYALLPVRSVALSHRDLVADIARRAQRALRMPIHAGLGSLAPGLPAMATSRRDADLVLRILADGGDGREEPLVAGIGELRARATLIELAERVADAPRLRDGVGPAVRRYDGEHGTAYADTLLAFLDSGNDVTETANRLNVHPNTCRYRLARAEEIFKFSLVDPDERLVLWLQLRLGPWPDGRPTPPTA